MATEKKSFDLLKNDKIETGQIKGGSNSRPQDLIFESQENGEDVIVGRQQSKERNSERTSDSL